jgi:hypothetical protein
MKGVYGENAGVELESVPSVVMTWNQWREAYPDGLVLSDDTGFTRAYKRSPYGTYLAERSIIFPLTTRPVKALDPKAVIVGIKTEGGEKAFQEGAIVQQSGGVKNDVVGGVDVVAWRHPNGAMMIHESEDVSFVSLTDNGILDSDDNEWIVNDNLDLVFEEQVLHSGETIQTFWFIWSVLYPDSHIYGYVLGKGIVDGVVQLNEGEGVEDDDGNFHLDVNDPSFGAGTIEVERN